MFVVCVCRVRVCVCATVQGTECSDGGIIEGQSQVYMFLEATFYLITSLWAYS